MSDLIKGFIYVKDPLTLFAFLALVLLAAFRTKQVPDLLFKLVAGNVDKFTFERLLRRFMTYALVAFVVVCLCAVGGQVLAHSTGSHPFSADDLKREFAASNAADEQKQAAAKDYDDALEQERNHRFDQAIESLKSSISQVPSLSAEYTLALFYHRTGDDTSASQHVEAATKLLKPGDTLAQLRVQRLAEVVRPDPEHPPSPDCQFVGGRKYPLPAGGSSTDNTEKISPGLYILNENVSATLSATRYYKTKLKAGQTLKIDFRTPDTGGWAFATIYDSSLGVAQKSGDVYGASQLKSIAWSPKSDGWVLLSVEKGSAVGSVYCIAVKEQTEP